MTGQSSDFFLLDLHRNRARKIIHKLDTNLNKASRELPDLIDILAQSWAAAPGLAIHRSKLERILTPSQAIDVQFNKLWHDDPSRLIYVYKRDRPSIRPADEVRWNIKKADKGNYYQALKYRERPPLWTRDRRNGLLFITGLESMKDSANPHLNSAIYDEDDVLLFKRNWPLTEERTGPSFKEFAKYD